MRARHLYALALLTLIACDDNSAGGATPDGSAALKDAVAPTLEASVATDGANEPSTKDAALTDGAPGPDASPRERFCQGGGAVVTLDELNTTQELCTGLIARRLFRQGICACELIDVVGDLRTRGYDARIEAEAEGNRGGASVGVNGALAIIGTADVGGSLSVGGPQNQWIVDMLIQGDLRLQGDTDNINDISVARDAWLGGDFLTMGDLEVGRDLHHAGAVEGLSGVGGAQTQEPVTLAPPCPCDAPIEIAPLLAQIEAENDNEAEDLSPRALKQISSDREITLPCGRYHLSEISGAGDVTIKATGRLALAVSGGIDLIGGLRFELSEGAEVDLFVGGVLLLIGADTLGAPESPGAVRIYTDTDGMLDWIALDRFGGNLYAPRAELSVIADLDLRGSFFVRVLRAQGTLSLLFDLAVGEAGADCDAPTFLDEAGEPQAEGSQIPCEPCKVCTGGEACVEGACGPCRGEMDCCGPSTCVDGACEWIMF